MKAVQIFLTKREYKITTMYRLELGSYILSEPVLIVSNKCSNEELTKSIHEALNLSKQLFGKEEDKYRIGSKELLKRLKESSFNKLYQNSSSCSVFIEESKIIIEPYEYQGKNQGLEVDEARILKLDINTSPLVLIEVIVDLLND